MPRPTNGELIVLSTVSTPIHTQTSYHPKDLTTRDCSDRLSRARKELQDARLSPADINAHLISIFKDIRKRFKPVMRHFFTEHRKDPQAWFEMRLHYSRSVAVTSIVGHILGLGDRHLSNILIDTITGEVVHIDLGIAFEQVRFRLSFLFTLKSNNTH